MDCSPWYWLRWKENGAGDSRRRDRRTGGQIEWWAGSGLLVAERLFRKVIGLRQIPLLLSSLANAVYKLQIPLSYREGFGGSRLIRSMRPSRGCRDPIDQLYLAAQNGNSGL